MLQLKIDQWAQQKPPLLAIYCQQVAFFADDLLEILSCAKNQEHITGLPEVAAKEWLRLYRKHRQLEQTLLAVRNLGEFAEFSVFLYQFLQSVQKMRKPQADKRIIKLSPKERKAITEALEEIYQISLAEIESEIKDLPLDQKTKEAVQNQLINQEFLFLLKVVVPCRLLYGTTPFQLIRQARLGDLKALEQLVRLDKMVLADYRIAQRVQRLLGQNKYKFDAVVVKSVRDAPKFALSPKNVKCLLGGLISLLSEAFGQKLEEPGIRSLFDAVAYDKSGGEHIVDPDLPDAPEAFAKAIQRQRKFWRPVFFPDKTF